MLSKSLKCFDQSFQEDGFRAIAKAAFTQYDKAPTNGQSSWIFHPTLIIKSIASQPKSGRVPDPYSGHRVRRNCWEESLNFAVPVISSPFVFTILAHTVNSVTMRQWHYHPHYHDCHCWMMRFCEKPIFPSRTFIIVRTPSKFCRKWSFGGQIGAETWMMHQKGQLMECRPANEPWCYWPSSSHSPLSLTMIHLRISHNLIIETSNTV